MTQINFFCKLCKKFIFLNSSSNKCCLEKIQNSKFLDFRYLVEDLGQGDIWSENYYNKNSKDYDDLINLTFKSLNCDENKERQKIYDMIDFKNIRSMLEVGCGTGRDTKKFIELLDNNAILHASDLSECMLQIAEDKFSDYIQNEKLNLYLCNAHSLPYEENQFDCVFHFGGINTFDDIESSINEMVRVCKVGGQIVIGDESIAPWQRETEFFKILSNSNPHFKFELPLNKLPQNIENVSIKFIMNSAFYIISFNKTKKEPKGDYHFEIPGDRGGTLWKRFHGNLEAIDPKLRDKFYEVLQKQDLSRVKVIEELIQKYLMGEKND